MKKNKTYSAQFEFISEHPNQNRSESNHPKEYANHPNHQTSLKIQNK